MSVGLCQSAAICCKRGTKKIKKQEAKKTNRLMEVTEIGFLGVRTFVFVLFFCFFCFFLVSWFLVFWFAVGFLKGWQNSTKVKDLDLTVCQFSHFRGCKLAFA